MHPEARRIKDTAAHALRSLSYGRDDASGDANARRADPLYIARPHPEQLQRITAAAARAGTHPCELWAERMEGLLAAYNHLFSEEGAAIGFRTVRDGADSCLIFEGAATLHTLRSLGAHLPGLRDLPRGGDARAR